MRNYPEVFQRALAGVAAIALTVTMFVSYYSVPQAQSMALVLA